MLTARRANCLSRSSVIAATLREVLGIDWSREIDAAWQKLLVELNDVIVQPQAQMRWRWPKA